MITKTILHVEDDPNDILLVQRAFRKAELQAKLQAVQDGDSAIAYLSGQGIYQNRELYPVPSLVLLDLKIPRKSGLEVLAWIRNQSGLRRLPVCVLTSSKHERDINLAYDTGANSYLVKPVGFDSLLNIVKLLFAFWIEANEQPFLELKQ